MHNVKSKVSNNQKQLFRWKTFSLTVFSCILNKVTIEQAKFYLTVVLYQQSDLILVLFSTQFQLRFIAHFHIRGRTVYVDERVQTNENKNTVVIHFMTSTTCSQNVRLNEMS